MMEPGRKPLIDLLFRRARVRSPQVLAHQGDSCLEEIEGHPERFGDVAMVRGHVSSLACGKPGVKASTDIRTIDRGVLSSRRPALRIPAVHTPIRTDDDGRRLIHRLLSRAGIALGPFVAKPLHLGSMALRVELGERAVHN